MSVEVFDAEKERKEAVMKKVPRVLGGRGVRANS